MSTLMLSATQQVAGASSGVPRRGQRDQRELRNEQTIVAQSLRSEMVICSLWSVDFALSCKERRANTQPRLHRTSDVRVRRLRIGMCNCKLRVLPKCCQAEARGSNLIRLYIHAVPLVIASVGRLLPAPTCCQQQTQTQQSAHECPRRRTEGARPAWPPAGHTRQPHRWPRECQPGP